MRTWTFEQEDLLCEKYPTATNAELVELFPDKTIQAIKTKALKLGSKKAKQMFRFTPKQLGELKRDYHNTSNIDLANRFRCSIHTIENIGFRHKLKKDIEFIRETAKNNFTENHPAKKYWIKKGTPPPNKGRKQVDYMTDEAIERTKATRFQKGQMIWNQKPVGYERITKDGYIEVKVSEPNVFKLKHRVIWEQKYGQIPAGHNIQFKDGNPLNCTIENFYMISRSDQLKNENSFYAQYPEEMWNLIQLKGVLKRQINKATNNGNN